jgi:menaquinone-dependent protoporphyrinogen oxidase
VIGAGSVEFCVHVLFFPDRETPVTRILLLHQSVYGHTIKISKFIGTELEARGDVVEVRPLADGAADHANFDAIVIGASIRHGKHSPLVVDFIRAQRALLESKPSAFFSVSLVARKPAKNTAETNPYVKKFIAQSPWKPKLVGVFGGVLDYSRYGIIDRYAIRLIMTITKGPTDLKTNTEFTNWEEVRRFAGRISALAAGQPS